jgi:hypothetical protein
MSDPKNSKRADTSGLIKPEFIAVNITPGLFEVKESVKRAMYWPRLAEKYEFHLPYHILNFESLVKFGIQSQMDASEEAQQDEFQFRLHESIYMENIRALGEAVGQMTNFIRNPVAAGEYHEQVVRVQNAYNEILEQTDKWDEWRANQQSWVQAFSIIACAHACIMTNMMQVDASPTVAERLFPFATQDVWNSGFPMEVLV